MIPPRHIITLAACTVLLTEMALAQFSFTDRTALIPGGDFNSGVAIGVADMNGDRKDDIVRINGSGGVYLVLQNSPDAAFSTRTVTSNGSFPWAVCMADTDRNGYNDILICPFGGGITLWTANGTASAYSSQMLPDTAIACQATLFGDLNNDGRIDIFSCDDNDDPHKYRNTGSGYVKDQSLMPSVLGGGGEDSSGNYGAVWTDFDSDGDLDLYLSKCRLGSSSFSDPRRINRLFENNGSSTYTDTAASLGLADGNQTWATEFADIDNDGDLDVFILNHGGDDPRMLENTGSGYTDITNSAGFGGDLQFTGINLLFRDFDNDGHADLLVSSTGSTYRLYRNNGNKTFTRQNNAFVAGGTTGGAGSPIGHLHSFGVGDLNQDGFLDVYAGRGSGFASPSGNPDHLFMNDGNANHSLTVQLKGVISNINAIGARATVYGPWGVQVREVRAGEGYGMQNSMDLHFGLGTNTTVDRLVVRWPSGFEEEFLNVPADQFLYLEESVDPGNFVTPEINSELEITARQNSAINYTISAANLPQSFTIANGPSGMTVNATGGGLIWTPTETDDYTVEISATNPAGTDTETLLIHVLTNSLNDAVDAPGLAISTGPSEWFLQTDETHDGFDAAQGGDIDNGGETWMEAMVNGPGTLSFWWRCSSEASYDFLRFSIDGSEEDSLNGETGWSQGTAMIEAGPHALRWSYTKDGSVSTGADTGWVDEVVFLGEDTDGDGLPDNWERTNLGDLSQDGTDDTDGDGADNASELQAGTHPGDPDSVFALTRAEEIGDGQLQLEWNTVPGKRYQVQVSTGHRVWSDVGGMVTANGEQAMMMVATAAPLEVEQALVSEDGGVRVLVPSADIGTHWRGGDEKAFAAAGGDASWTAGWQGVGYETGSGYETWIGQDVLAMRGQNTSVYLRMSFEVADASAVTAAGLEMRYDDGFVAYINGVEVARERAPASPGWSSSATQNHEAGTEFDLYAITDAASTLVDGANVLAIHGLNGSLNSSDLLFQARLRATAQITGLSKRAFWRVSLVE